MIYGQYELYMEESTELVAAFEAAYDQILSSNSAYDDRRDALITELGNLINVRFVDLMDTLDDAQSQLNGITGEFFLKTIALDILSSISTTITSVRDSATAAQEVSSTPLLRITLIQISNSPIVDSDNSG